MLLRRPTSGGGRERPERFLNCHWLNPAYLIPLVEISPHPGTAPAAIEKLKTILEAIGKKPVVCKAAPGFIVPRLQALVMNEAARMIEQGIAPPRTWTAPFATASGRASRRRRSLSATCARAGGGLFANEPLAGHACRQVSN